MTCCAHPAPAAALFFVATSVLSAGDHALVQHTNYATNLETPRLLGADVQHIELRLEDGFALDLERLAGDVRPSTAPDLGHHAAQPHRHHAADSTSCTRWSSCAERHSCWLLVDETYREMSRDEPLPMAASLSERAISVSSVSKTYGLPGLRLGWVVTRHAELFETLLAARSRS